MTSAFGDLDLKGLLGEEPFVRRLAKSLLFDDHQVDDVVQQAWTAALNASHTSRSWLATVVRTRAANVRRDAARRAARERAAARVEALPSTQEMLEREELRRQVVSAVAALPEKYRVVVLLRFYEGLPPREIAAELGEKRDTIATRLKRGLAMLRDNLDSEHGGDRRAWAIGLVPLAAPGARIGATSALVVKAGTWLGAITAMKQLVLVVVGAIVLFMGWAFASDMFSAAEPRAIDVGGVPSVEVEPEPNEPGPVAIEPSVETVARDAVEDSRPGARRFASVDAALCGFRGRVVLPNGAPAVDELVRLIGLDPVNAMGSVFDPDGLGAGVIDSGPTSRAVRTADNGTFIITGARPEALYALHAGVDGEHPTWTMVQRTAGPAQQVELGTIQLTAKGRITGVVVDDEGEPVVDAEVWSADFPGGVMSVAPVDRIQPKSGLFVAIPRVEFESADASGLHAYHDQLRSHFGKRVTQASDETQFVALDLPAWFDRLYHELPIARTTTDAEGRFELKGLPKGGAALVVRSPGFLNGGKPRVLVRPNEVRDVGQIELRRGECCAGIVLDEVGAAVRGAELRIAAQPNLGLTGLLFAGPPLRVDSAGRFSCSGLPREEIFIAARRGPGQAWVMFGPFDSDDEEIEIEFAAPIDIPLSVSSAGEDLELKNLRIVVRRGPPLGELTVAGLQPELPLEKQIDGGSAVIKGVESGAYTLQVSADGHAVAVEVVRAETDMEPIEIRLEPTARTELVVVDSDGAPIEGAQVFAQSATTPAWARSVLFGYGSIQCWDQLARFVGFTDERGTIDVAVLPAGRTTLSVRHPAFGVGWTAVELPTLRTEITLNSCGVVRGVLFDGGKPASADKHRLVATLQGDVEAPMPSLGGQAVPNELGEFRFEGLSAGRYKLTVKDSLRDVSSMGGLINKLELGPSWGFGADRSVDVDVVAGEEHEVSFDVDAGLAVPGSGGTLRFVVTVDGRPAEGFEVLRAEFGPERRSLGVLDSRGVLLTEELVAETMPLEVRDRKNSMTLWTSEVGVVAGNQTELRVDLRMATIEGQVLRADGRPAPQHDVILVADFGGEAFCHRAVRTGPDGRFKVLAPAASYMIKAEGVGGHGSVTAVPVEPGSTHRQDLRLSGDRVLSGRVVSPDRKIQYIRVEGHDYQAMFSLGEGGTFALVGLEPGTFDLLLLDENFDRFHGVPRLVDVPVTGLLDQEIRVGERQR